MYTLIFTILSVIYDKGARFTNHAPRFLFRSIAILIISYLEKGFDIYNLLFNIAVFYIVFDYLLNVAEFRKWNYIGNTAIHDIIWNKYLGGWIPQLVFKLLFLTITTLLKWKIF